VLWQQCFASDAAKRPRCWESSKNVSKFSMQKMFYRVQGTQDQTMLQRDYLCASGYSQRPLVDFSWCSVGRPTKTFQHFHRAAAWYDAAQRHCVWAFTQGHCYANHLRKRVLTYAIYAMLRKKKRNIRNNTRYPGGGVRTPPPQLESYAIIFAYHCVNDRIFAYIAYSAYWYVIAYTLNSCVNTVFLRKIFQNRNIFFA